MLVEHRPAVNVGMPFAGHRVPSSIFAHSACSVPQVLRTILRSLRVPSVKSHLSLDFSGHASNRGPVSTTPFSSAQEFPGVRCINEFRLAIYVSSEFTDSKTGVIFLRLSHHTINENGKQTLVDCIYLLTGLSVEPGTRRRVVYRPLTSFLHSRRPRSNYIFPVKLASRNHSRRLMSYHTFSHIRSLFTFLRCPGPRGLPPARHVILDQEGYQITHIGRGSFAVISRVFHRASNSARVVKRIAFEESGLAEYLAETEVDCLKAMSGNKWLPPLLNYFMDAGEFVISMPFYRRGDLAGLLEHKGYLGRELARFYSAELVLAIQSLHKQGIVHRDIKPDNILLDDAGHLLLADLGLAENLSTLEGGVAEMKRFPVWLEARANGGDDFPMLWVDGHNPLGTRGVAGTYWYTAPEVFRNERYSFGVDYWSVGLIYHELVTGHIPFKYWKPYPENQRPVLDYTPKPGQLKFIESWEQQVLDELLHPAPCKRPRTVANIKSSPLFDGIDWEKMTRRETFPPALPLPLHEG